MSLSDIPNTQARASKTFVPPKHLLEDPETTVIEFYAWNRSHNAGHPLFRFLDGHDIRTISWGEAVEAIQRAACLFASQIDNSTLSHTSPPVVAILANTDTITYFCSIVALFWAGFTAFPISPRNGAEAVADLLARTGASYLYISSEARLSSLATIACQILQTKGNVDHNIEIRRMPVFDDLFCSTGGTLHTDLLITPRKRDLDAPLIILHSSGSTAHPKPVAWSARRLKQWTLVPWYGDLDFTGLVMSCHAMPMFHGMGVLQINSAASSGLIIATFKPMSPATFPTPVNVFQEAVATESELICCVPSFVEEWGIDDSKIAHMKTLKGMIFGGGPLSQETGDRLAQAGIALYQQYGCTEVGVMNTFLPLNPGMDWEYVEMSKQFRSGFQPKGDGTYELVLVAANNWKPAVVNTKIDGRDAYATNDLFIPHLSKPNLWKIYGRTDDQIILSTGEKTNPGPLESILSQDPHIRFGVIFGRGKFHNGIVLDPAEGHAFDPRDTAKLEHFKQIIWPTITRMNAFAPQHSRIFKEMIMVASPSKPFTYTAKGTPQRQAIISDYAQEIDALYASARDKPSAEISPPTTWSPGDLLPYVRQLVHSILNRHIGDDYDIFQYGCDSLQAAWIRNAILHAAQISGQHLDTLPSNFVFQAPSIDGICALILRSIEASAPASKISSDLHAQELLDLVARFTSNFPSRPTTLHPVQTEHDVVLLTGSTGGLGCHILVELVADPSVQKIYALTRGTDTRQRQLDSLIKQGLASECISSPKVVFLEGELSESTLGLGTALYEEVRRAVTHIIHSAWKVDFSQSVKSFDKQLIGLRNLVDLAISSPHDSPPSLLFISSIGIFRNIEIPGLIPEDPIQDPGIVIGMGYAEAKWVGERVLEEARSETGLRGVVVRVGQLCGSQNGYWNEREWFPTVVQSAEYLRCLPDIDEEGLVSWIPSANAAKAISQMRCSEEAVLHLVHPQPVAWKTLLSPIADTLQVPLVPYEKWLAALEACLPNNRHPETAHLQQYPALRLLEFFRSVKVHPSREPLGMARLDLRKALATVPALQMAQLTSSWASRWLNAWRMAGLLSQECSVGLRG